MGGLFLKFESLEDVGAVAACQRERGRGDGVSATSRHRDAVGVATRESTRVAREPRGSSTKSDLRGITHEERLHERVRSFIQTPLCFRYLLVPI